MPPLSDTILILFDANKEENKAQLTISYGIKNHGKIKELRSTQTYFNEDAIDRYDRLIRAINKVNREFQREKGY